MRNKDYRNSAGRFRLEVSDQNSFTIAFDHNGSVVDKISAYGDNLEDLKDLQYLLSRALENRT